MRLRPIEDGGYPLLDTLAHRRLGGPDGQQAADHVHPGHLVNGSQTKPREHVLRETAQEVGRRLRRLPLRPLGCVVLFGRQVNYRRQPTR